jgi:hypothetical protein
MRQANHLPFNMTQMVSFGFLTVLLSFSQSVSTSFAQQMTERAGHETDGAGSPDRRIDTFDPSRASQGRSIEKRDSKGSPRKPHRLIRKARQNPVATVAPSPTASSPSRSLPAAQPPAQSDDTASSNEPSSQTSSSPKRSIGAAGSLATMSIASPSETASPSMTNGAVSAGPMPLAAVGAVGSSTSRRGSTGGRSMGRLAAEMPELTQLITPPPAPVVSTNPVIRANPPSLSFTAQQGGSNPATQTLSISNTGGGTLSWSASNGTPWLSLSSTSGTGSGMIGVNVSTGTLTAGNYSGTVILNATGAPSVIVPVIFTVTAAPVPPAIGASPASFAFTATQGGNNPANQTLSISNTGGGTLSWSASDNAPWLTLSPASGTGNGTVTLTAATGTLTVGTHNGTVTVTATGATTRTVPVAFTVTAAPTINVSPSSLSYAATQGAANPANQNISLTNSGGTLTWTVSDDASWLAVSPASGSGSSTLTTSVNTAGLTTGTYNGTLTVSAAGTASKTVAVTLTVNAPATSSATLTWNANKESDLAGYKIYRATTSGGYGAPIATVQGNVTTYSAAGLQLGTTYFFVITAYDSAGNESPFSNEVSKSIF